MGEQARYRTEDGAPVVDVRIASIERLFDNRDPAPFRERDLDPDLVEYLVAAAEDVSAHRTFRVVFWLERPCDPGEVEHAVRAHFAYELDRVDRRRRRQRRIGQLSLLVAVIAIVGLLSLAQVVATALASSVGAALKEGLVISCWVLMWRPVEVLVYDWIPWRRERRVFKRLAAMPIEVRAGPGPMPFRSTAP